MWPRKAATNLNQFLVFSVVDQLQADQTVAFVHEESLRRMNVPVDSKPFALIIGRTRSQTLCTIVGDAGFTDGYVALNAAMQMNLNVHDNDTVDVKILPAIDDVTALTLAPCSGSPLADIRSIKEHFIMPYFSASRLVHVGNMIKITRGDLSVSFVVQVVTTASGKKYGQAGCNTTISTTEPVSKPERAIGYDDIGGLKNQLPQIREVVELTLNNPHLFQDYGVKKPKGVLLFGPPGTGKTYIARAIANEVGAFFLGLTGPEIVGKLAGESEQNLRLAFDECKKHKRAILFIDEIDSIAPKRDKTQGELERRIVAQLLTLMDGVTSTSNVIVMAATNRPNSIDPALRRPGRFDREINIGIPDEEARLEILRVHTKRMLIGTDVNLSKIARYSHGYVGADLAALCCEAAFHQIREMAARTGPIPEARNNLSPINMKNFEDALAVTNASGLRELAVETPDVRWEDIGGLESVKRELKETVEYPIQYPEYFTEFGISPSRGVLFYGPPGCGKTLLAKAVAKQCNANFISVKGPELLTMWFGESEANVRDLFDKARSAAPCIIFFDEIDSIAKSRGSSDGGAGAASDRVINQLLTEMDGVGIKKKIFIIGATNRPDVIDAALLRPGRLDQLIYIALPDENNRLAILEANLRRTKLSPEVKANLALIAHETVGFSGADLAEICQRACKLAIRERIHNREAYNVDRAEREKRDTLIQAEDFHDQVTEVGARHFEEAMRYANKSVSDDEVRVYEIFSQQHKKQSDNFANFKFKPTLPTASTSAGNDEEDMYA